MEHGVQCTLSSCRRLSFLPINCRHCAEPFCESHHFPDQHACEASSRLPASEDAARLGRGQTRKQCEVKGCNAFSLELLPSSAAGSAGFTHAAPKCERCSGSYCMT